MAEKSSEYDAREGEDAGQMSRFGPPPRRCGTAEAACAWGIIGV